MKFKGIDKLTIGNTYRPVLEAEKEAVSRFGTLAKLILSESVPKNYEDMLSKPRWAGLWEIFEDEENEDGRGFSPVQGLSRDIREGLELGFRLEAPKCSYRDNQLRRPRISRCDGAALMVYTWSCITSPCGKRTGNPPNNTWTNI